MFKYCVNIVYRLKLRLPSGKILMMKGLVYVLVHTCHVHMHACMHTHTSVGRYCLFYNLDIFCLIITIFDYISIFELHCTCIVLL